jgi:hypothetical protein
MQRIAALALLLGSACGGQSEPCRTYVECRKAYDREAGNQPADLAAWEPDGDCWVNGDTAAACTADCEEQLIEVRDAVEAGGYDVPECA